MTLSPLDARYASKIKPIDDCLGSDSYLKLLVLVELEWLSYFIGMHRFNSYAGSAAGFGALKKWINSTLADIRENKEDSIDLQRIRDIEKETGHDVKAVEYFIKEQLVINNFQAYKEIVHIGCTSEDITNLAYAIGLGQARKALSDLCYKISEQLYDLASSFRHIPMLAFTHGQPASPTTIGKEFAVYVERLAYEKSCSSSLLIKAKFAGATGNHSALSLISNLDPIKLSSEFIKRLERRYNVCLIPAEVVTQVESHDSIAAILHSIIRTNNILTDLSCDMWQYIGKSYFKLSVDRIGSSTMPHKINPIEFENAEGNFGLANNMLSYLADKLTVSRMQRDLSGSTVKRNLGVAIGHAYLGYSSVLKGLKAIQVNESAVAADLLGHEEVLTEAAQTFLRVNPDILRDINQHLGNKQALGPYEIVKQSEKRVLSYLRDKDLLDIYSFQYIGRAETIVAKCLDQTSTRSDAPNFEKFKAWYAART